VQKTIVFDYSAFIDYIRDSQKRTKQQTGRLVTAREKLYKMGLVIWTLHYFSEDVATLNGKRG
jgi:hypothetical protein